VKDPMEVTLKLIWDFDFKCCICKKTYRTPKGYLKHVRAKHKGLLEDLEIILADMGFIPFPK